MSWDSAEKEVNQASGGKFLRLEPGQSFVGVFVGDPQVRRTVWDGSRTVDYTEGLHKPDDIKLRVKLAVWIPAETTYKIWEMSGAVFKSLGAQRKEYAKDFSERAFKVAREGSGKDTKYIFFPKDKLDSGELEAMRSQDPPSLEPQADGSGSQPAVQTDDIPI